MNIVLTIKHNKIIFFLLERYKITRQKNIKTRAKIRTTTTKTSHHSYHQSRSSACDDVCKLKLNLWKQNEKTIFLSFFLIFSFLSVCVQKKTTTKQTLVRFVLRMFKTWVAFVQINRNIKKKKKTEGVGFAISWMLPAYNNMDFLKTTWYYSKKKMFVTIINPSKKGSFSPFDLSGWD